jgi:hypothetical protein
VGLGAQGVRLDDISWPSRDIIAHGQLPYCSVALAAVPCASDDCDGAANCRLNLDPQEMVSAFVRVSMHLFGGCLAT